MKQDSWRWKVVFRDPDFIIPLNEIRHLEFSLGVSQAMRCNVDWTPKSNEMRRFIRDITLEEKAHLESSDVQMNTHWLYKRIRQIWGLNPNEWSSDEDMFQWYYDNKVYFFKLSEN